MTQVNKTQVKDDAIYDHHVATNANIQWPKIDKTFALPSDIGAENALTFTLPLHRVGNVISINSSSLAVPVLVTQGGTGLTSIPDNSILFGSPGNSALDFEARFAYDSLTGFFTVPSVKVLALDDVEPLIQVQNNGSALSFMSYTGLGANSLNLYYVDTANDITWNTVTKYASIFSINTGTITLANASDNGFSTLYFGGDTVGKPALKVSGAELDVKLGDDSDYGTLGLKTLSVKTGGSVTFSDASTMTTAAIFTNTTKGLVPATAGAVNEFLRSDGTWAASTGGVVGGGTTGYIPKFTDVGTLGNSPVFTDGTRIALGTTTIAGMINIISPTADALINITRTAASDGKVGISFKGGTAGHDWSIYQDTSSNKLSFIGGTVTSTPITLDSSYVGINVAAPARDLDVNGLIRSLGGQIAASNSGTTSAAILGAGANGPYVQGKNFLEAVTEPLLLNPEGANVGVNTTNPDAFPLQVLGNAGPDAGYAYNLGSSARKWLTLNAAELNVETLVAQDVLATIGGRILVGPTTQLTVDLSNVGTSISTKHNNLAPGDILYLEGTPDGLPSVEFMSITSGPTGPGPYVYIVSRNLDGTGANAWYAGSAIFNTGQAGNGFIDLYSTRGVRAGTEVGPTIVGNIRGSSTYNDWAPNWAIGNLNGLYGYSSNIYGAAFGVPTATWIKIDPTNGIRMGNSATTKVSIDAAGNASFAGAITSTSGAIGGWDIGATTLSSGGITLTSSVTAANNKITIGAGNYDNADTSFYVGGDGKFSLQDKLVWSGSTLSINGSITSTFGTIGGWTLGGTSLTAGSGANTVGLDSGGTNPAFYAGSATAVSAPFRVTPAGAITATAGTIGGLNLAANKVYSGTGTFNNANTPFYIDSTIGDTKFSLGNQLNWEQSTGILTVVGGITVAATWGGLTGRPAELTDGRVATAIGSSGQLLNTVAAPASGAGLFLGSDKMGYFASATWKTYIDNAGNFALGDTGVNTNPGLVWNQAGGSLTVKGSITITGGSGYANLSDKPANLAALDSTAGTKLSGIAAGATVGATWGVNLGSIPTPLTAPSGAGLYISATNMGYYNGTLWKTYMDNTGNLILGDIAGGGVGLSWSQGSGSLSIKGTINATSGQIGGLTMGSTKIYAGVGTYGNANTQFYVDNAGQFSLGSNLTWNGTALSITGSVTITGGSGYGNISDRPTTLAALDSTAGTKLSGIAAGATVGATWGSNLTGIPGTLATPSGSGLFLSATNMGYYTAGVWKTYMDSSGNLALGDTGANTNPGLYWNQVGGVLTVKGTITATAGFIGGISLSGNSLYSGVGYYANANTPFYVSNTGNFSLGSKLYWNGTTLTINGTITATAGSIAGLTINNNALYYGVGTYANANTAFYVDNAGKFSLGDKLYWNGSALNINGNFSTTYITIDANGITIPSNDFYTAPKAITFGSGSRIWASTSNILLLDGGAGVTVNGNNGVIVLNGGPSVVISSTLAVLYSALTISATNGISSNTKLFTTGGSDIEASGQVKGATGYFGATTFTGAISGGANTLGIGAITCGAIAATGNISATGDVIAYFSDARLKENIVPISSAMDKVSKLRGVYFNSNDAAAAFGYTDKARQVGVIAQEVQAVLPEVVVDAPIGNGYLTVQYHKIVPLLIEAIKELNAKIEKLESERK